MKKRIVFLGTVLAIFFLTSCSSTQSVVPKAFPGSAELFKVNNAGTVVVKGYNINSCPDYHPGAGGKSWVFADEIIIR